MYNSVRDLFAAVYTYTAQQRHRVTIVTVTDLVLSAAFHMQCASS